MIVYFILSLTSISERISIPYSILTSVIVFSIANYYYKSRDRTGAAATATTTKTSNKKQKGFLDGAFPPTTLLFTFVYFVFLLILAADQNSNATAIFVDWNNLTLSDAIHLAAAIGISIYLPGFAIVSTLDRRNQISGLGKHLLGYLFSIFVAGIIGFGIAASGQAFHTYYALTIVIYTIILALFVIIKLGSHYYNNKNDKNIKFDVTHNVTSTFRIALSNYWLYIVFANLLMFVILSSYYLYGATLVGDQLYHHGRAITFMDGSFQTLVANGLDVPYLPLMHGFLSTVFSLSGIPSANVYITLGFLNIMPVFAFYYFFSKWFPYHKRASILAACLFMLGSGFGWVHVMSLASTDVISSTESAFNLIDLGGRNTFDIRLPASFLNNGSLTKPIILFALPYGLVLLGLIKENLKNKALLISILSIITFGGLISHEEFAIFLIVAFILQFVFRFDNSRYFFASVTLSVLLASIFIAAIFPSQSQVVREVLGFPFTILLFFIALVFWAIHIVWSRFNNDIRRRLTFAKITIGRRSKLLVGLIITAIICYLYLFTFVTWSQISFSDIHAQVSEQGARVVPWYLYPMRVGVPGLLGLAYLLSYFFKKYERETFVFLIIALVAVVSTPFYNEHRLNKYLMLSADGLASLLVYKIISNYIDRKKILTGFVIAGVIVSSGMSIIIYQGYVDLALQNPNTNMYISHRYKPQDIGLLNFIHKNIDLKVDNVALPNDFEHHFRRHHPGSYIAEQIEGYAGLQLENRLTHASSILQSSTLEGFYSLVNSSNTKYIVFPRDYIDSRLTDIGAFVLNNFPRVYDGHGGIIVSVPNSTEPSIPSEVSIVLPQNAIVNSTEIPINLKAVNDTRTLSFTNMSDITINENSLVNRAYLSEHNNTIILVADSNGVDVWHNKGFENRNDFGYFEVNLKVKSTQKGTQDHAGVLLEYGNKTYYVFLRPHAVSAYNPVDKEFARNNTFIREQDVWHNIKIVAGNDDDNSYNVYVDNKHVLKFPKLDFEKVVRVGVRALNAVAEFSPITMGNPVQEHFLSSNTKVEFDKTMNYYYPLSISALAHMNYSSLFDGDLAVPSTNSILLTFDPQNINEYLGYAQAGKTVVIFNPDETFSGGFSKFLGITPIQFGHFSELERISDNTHLELKGRAMNLSIGSPGSTVTSYYTAKESNDTNSINKNNDDDVNSNSRLSSGSSSSHSPKIPFAIEQEYGRGKIIYVNIRGLFDAVQEDAKNSSFLAIEKIPQLIGLNYSKVKDEPHIQVSPPIRSIGGIRLSGNTTILGHNLFFPIADGFSTDGILAVNNKQNNHSILRLDDFTSSTHIRNLSLSGPFSLIIKTSDVQFLPTVSPNAYTGFALSNGFDMKIQPSRSSFVQIEYTNDSGSLDTIRTVLNDSSSIIFRNITSSHSNLPSLVTMIKNPTISFSGNAEISDLYSRRPDNPSLWLANGDMFRHDGNLTFKIAHIENFKAHDNPNFYATYLDFIGYDNEYQHQREESRYQKLSLPGDVSEYAKENRIYIPVGEVIFSEVNKKALYSFTIVAIVSIYFSWGRIKNSIKNR
jgi:hypothetical protein